MIRNSLKQLLRTPVRVLMFFALVIVAGIFLSLGANLWILNQASIADYENKFMTIGTMEQKKTSLRQETTWDAEEKNYQIQQRPVYSSVVPVSEAVLDDFEYIQKPENRAYYGSYVPEYMLDGGEDRVTGFEDVLVVAEFSPLEDCVPSESLQVKINKIISGSHELEGTLMWICAHNEKNPKPLSKDKTYIAYFVRYLLAHGDAYEKIEKPEYEVYDFEYVPTDLTVREYAPDGTLMKNPPLPEETWLELTEGFYETEIGKRYLEWGKGLLMLKHIQSVTGTNKTTLLMPFYTKDAYISEGRDISREEYEAGERVCLIPRSFAENNELLLGDSVHTRFRFTNARNSAGQNFFVSGGTHWDFELVDVEGKEYPVFEENEYKIVGIYDLPVSEERTAYDMGSDEIIVPMNSIKNRESKNIVDYGPMLGTTASFEIQNGGIESFMKEWEKSGNEEIELTFYDMGYSELQSGLENMKSMALLLLSVGALMVVFLLLFFTHLFITKQKTRTAIERSLGVSKGKCRTSLLVGLMLIIVLGSGVGSGVGGALSQRISVESMGKEYYSALYSNVAQIEAIENDVEDANTHPIFGTIFSAVFIVALGIGISVYRINKSLKHEPMRLLSEEKEE